MKPRRYAEILAMVGSVYLPFYAGFHMDENAWFFAPTMIIVVALSAVLLACFMTEEMK